MDSIKILSLVLLLLVDIAYLSPPLQLQYPSKSAEFSFNHEATQAKSRLPSSLLPISYKLDLTPILDPTASDFLAAPGFVAIKFCTLESTNTIVLHIFEILIGDILVEDSGGGVIGIVGSEEDTNAQTLSMTLTETLAVNSVYEVKISFTSRVADDRLDGLYLSQYVDVETGLTIYQAATQFQTVRARKAFPCFDEPALRAKFEIRLGRQETVYHTLCNMNLQATIAREDRIGYVWDVYPETNVTMPTYLVAILVSNFASEEAPPELFSKPVKVWGPIPNMASSDATFAAETGAQMLAFFENYFQFDYEMPKMDSVAVPQFAAGAMENWGLNLYRVNNLLMTQGESTVLDNWKIAVGMGHEVAHQWFGNLVTFKWWNDAWLSEGFAHYFQFVAANVVRPEFEPLERTGLDASLSGLEFDGGQGSVPVRSADDTVLYIPPSQIIYQKASSLVRMMQGFLTEATLQRGLQNYLREKQYDSAVQDELFQYLTEQAQADGSFTDFTVKEVMDTWTTQPGFPLIRVSRGNERIVYFSQERFKNDANFSSEAFTWFVPIAFTSESNPVVTPDSLQPKIWLTKDQAITNYEIDSTNQWIIVNPDAKGHFRVLYDENFTELLQVQLELNHELITPLSRAQLFDDYFKCAYGEYTTLLRPLELTSYLHEEASLAPWSAVLNNINILKIYLADDLNSELRTEFKNYFLNKLSPAIGRIGILPAEEESPVAMLLRTELVDWACALELPLCFETAKRLVDDWMNSNLEQNSIPVDLQPMFYCAAVFSGGQTYSDFMLEKYQVVGISGRQSSLLLDSLACSNITEQLTLALNMSLDEESPIRGNDAVRLMQGVAQNDAGRQIAFEFIKNNVPEILISRVGEEGISAAVDAISSFFTTVERHNELKQFLDLHEEEFSLDLIAKINASLLKIEANIRWMGTHRSSIEDFFLRMHFK